MVDVVGITEGSGAAASQALIAGTIYITLALVGVAVIALVFYARYRASFNHMVWIRRPIGSGGFEYDVGHTGRFIFKQGDGDSKRQIFQIYKAKKNKLNYNEENDTFSKRLPCLVKGKRRYLVIMQPDEAGFLQPVEIRGAEDGNLAAVVTQADIAFFEAELQNISQKYDRPSFMQQYGLIIYLILIIVVAALFWWGTRNNAEAMRIIASAVETNAAATLKMTELYGHLINGSINNQPPPVILG